MDSDRVVDRPFAANTTPTLGLTTRAEIVDTFEKKYINFTNIDLYSTEVNEPQIRLGWLCIENQEHLNTAMGCDKLSFADIIPTVPGSYDGQPIILGRINQDYPDRLEIYFTYNGKIKCERSLYGYVGRGTDSRVLVFARDGIVMTKSANKK